MPTVRRRDVPADVWTKLTEAAGVPAAKPRAAPDVRTRPTGRWSITLALACRVVSEANRRDHWTVQRRRAEIQGQALVKALDAAGLTNHRPPLPIVVTWVRTGGRPLDDDNLSRAFKSLRDRLAEWVGVDDADPRVRWVYAQRDGEPGVEVTVGTADQPTADRRRGMMQASPDHRPG